MNYITKVRDIMTTTAINNTMKYSLQQFKEITFHGFDFVIPEDAMAIINYLTGEVGPSTYINSPIFQKRNIKKVIQSFLQIQIIGIEIEIKRVINLWNRIMMIGNSLELFRQLK